MSFAGATAASRCIDFQVNADRIPDAAAVLITSAAQAEFAALPRTIQPRVLTVFERLEKWPQVSGAKSLRGELHGSWRIRTGDHRIIFIPSADGNTLTVWKIGYRGGIYD